MRVAAKKVLFSGPCNMDLYGLTLYEYLNRGYWPVTYAEIRRLADFQNRVFANYARVHRLPFIDIASEYRRSISC